MTKPQALPVKFENIPLALKKIPRWVLWRFVEVGEDDNKRWSKLPLQAAGNAASSSRPETWTDFVSAEEAYSTGKFDGVGFVFDGTDGLVGVDLDDCYDAATGQFTNAASKAIAESIDGYMEVSPSGTGVKIFTLADLKAAHVDHGLGLEVYPRGRYFTVTGAHLGGSVPASEQDLSGIIPERTIARSGDAFADYTPPVEGFDIARVENEVLAHLDPDCGYDEWLKIGMALHHQFNGDVEACEAWDRWSQGPDGSCGGYTPGLCDSKWRSFSGGGTTLRSLLFTAKQKKLADALQRGEIVLDQAPVSHARKFLDTLHTGEEGVKLVHYADDYFVHRNTHYEEIEEATVRSQMYKFLDQCSKQDRKGNIVPFQPNPATVSAALDATKALVHLPNHVNTKPPVWLEGYGKSKPDAAKLISLKNGLFHLEESVLLPHSLGFFTRNSLPFEYDPQAKCPRWMDFLNQVWENDQQSIECLQEMFGYIISGDTRQQKFFNIIGPRRSGKGTINKVLVELLGQHNTVAPELGELNDTFGLQPWLGKLLASFTDARAPEKSRSTVVSQLLRIVGGDTVTVNRKNKEAWNGYLPTRIVIYSNEMLQLTENSNALTGRMIVIKMVKTFYDKEDTDLANKLMAELSGVFNWAVEGMRRRLARGGQFIQPESGKMALHDMEEQSNPIGAFFEETMELDQTSFLDKDDVFMVYKKWAGIQGMHPGTNLTFKRRFLAAIQGQPVEAAVMRNEGDRAYIYRGVRFKKKWKSYVDGLGNYKEDLFQ